MNSAQVAEILHKPPEWHEQRRTCIGGSDANRIMKGEIFQLWLEMTGRAERESLDDVLAVQLGTFTEPFNRFWFEKITGLTVEPAKRIVHPEYEFLAANLDGVCEGMPWEAKHTGQYSKEDEILQRYYPQMQHQIMVAGTQKAILSVIFGNNRFQTFTIDADYPYQQQLITREMQLWQCIQNDTPPVEFTPTVEVSFSDMREVDMSESNSWASLAHAWKDNKKPAKEFANAADELKALVPSDACLAYGHGVKVSRSKSGSLTIKEM